MTSRSFKCKSAAALTAAGVLVLAGCGWVSQRESPSGIPPPSPSDSTGRPTSSTPPRRSSIDMECENAQSGLGPDPTEIRGVASALFAESAPDHWGNPVRAGGRDYYALKTAIYTQRGSSARTTISVLEPTTALLDYPGWSTWSGTPKDGAEAMTAALARATTTISVPRCGDDVYGWPGQLLLESPGCITLRLVGKNPNWEETVTLAKGTQAC